MIQPICLIGVAPRALASAAVCLCAVLLAGCASRAAAPGAAGVAGQTSGPGGEQAQEEWFCQVGSNNDVWDCVREARAGATKKPTRLPEPRSVTRADSAPAPTAPDFPVPPAAAAAVSASPSPPPAAPTPEPAGTAPGDLPRHIELSYRPSKPVAIVDLPDDFYAVQLVAVSSKAALEKYARDRRLSGMSAARIHDGEQLYYVLLLGIYETRSNAQLAIESLSGPLAELSPWIRSVGSLQRAMLEADRITGTEDY